MSNFITVTGNLTRDPELKFMESGNAMARMSVAVTRKVKETEQTSFFDVIAWGKLAENVSTSVGKGSRVTVSGRLEQRAWEDKDGNKRSTVEIIADEIAASMRFNSVSQERSPRTPASTTYGPDEDVF